VIDEKRAQQLKAKYRDVQQMPARKATDAVALGPRGGPRGPAARFTVTKPKDARRTLRRFVQTLRGHEGAVFLAFFLTIAHTVTTLAASYMLRPIINRTIAPENGQPSIRGLALMLLFMAGLYLSSLLCHFAAARVMLTLSQKIQKKLRDDLFQHMMGLPVRFFDTRSTGEIMSRFVNDIDVMGELLNGTVVQILTGAVMVTGTLSLMVYTNLRLSLVALVATPLTALCAKLFTDAGSRFFRAQQTALGTLNGYLEESINGQKVVQVFCHEDIAADEFDFLNDDLREKQAKAQSIGGAMMPVMTGINNLSYVLVACAGVILHFTSGFDIGGLAILVNYSRQFGRPINELSGQINVIYSALAGAERVFEILDSDPELPDEPDACGIEGCEGTVRLEHVTFGYLPGKPVLRDVSFEARRGQKIAFVGSTGAGKTTVANLIPRFYDVDEGSVTVDGADVRSIRRDSLRENITFILQDTHLFTGTVMENIRYGRLDATDDEVVEAAKTANAHRFISRLEHGYETMLGQDGANLSQGQRQLLNIARAALSKAPVLIMDEATSSIDTRAERQIESGLSRLSRDRTTIVIAHRLSTVRDADRIIVLENGAVVESGTHDELLEIGGRYYELYAGIVELT